jgi:hypothetical protein
MSDYFAKWKPIDQRAKNAAAQVYKEVQCTTADCADVRAKARSMGVLGSVFGSSAYDIYYNSSGNAFAILFYISITLFVGFLILAFIHFTAFPVFSFSPNDSGFISVPTASDRQITFDKGLATYDVSANLVSLPACNYTLGADVYVAGDFMISQVPRVILYRSSAPVTAGGREDNLDAIYSETNIIVWLDPIKNDLYVSVVTSDGIQTTGAIENVPIRKAFRLAIAFTTNFIEVYMNGKLEQSMAIQNTLRSIPDTSNIYSSVKPIMQNVRLANLTMWPRVLTSREIHIHEAAPINESILTQR